MGRKIKKVEDWDLRFEDPYSVYQSILGKLVKRKKLDEEEKSFTVEVDKMLKSGELKVLHINDEGYDELAKLHLQRSYPNEYIEFYANIRMPQWAQNYFKQVKVWLSNNPNSTENDYQIENGISMKWKDVEYRDGKVFIWQNESDKTFMLMKLT